MAALECSDQAMIDHAHRLRSVSPSALCKRYLRINRHVIDCAAPFNLHTEPYTLVAMAIHGTALPIRNATDTVEEALA